GVGEHGVEAAGVGAHVRLETGEDLGVGVVGDVRAVLTVQHGLPLSRCPRGDHRPLGDPDSKEAPLGAMCWPSRSGRFAAPRVADRPSRPLNAKGPEAVASGPFSRPRFRYAASGRSATAGAGAAAAGKAFTLRSSSRWPGIATTNSGRLPFSNSAYLNAAALLTTRPPRRPLCSWTTQFPPRFCTSTKSDASDPPDRNFAPWRMARLPEFRNRSQGCIALR